MVKRHPIPTHKGFQDLTGRRFRQLTVLYYVGPEPGHQLWRCRCACGRRTTVRSNNLLNDHTTTCGCALVKRQTAGPTAAHFRHGGSHSPEWVCWQSMKGRCCNRRNPAYADYGGRGISVCHRLRGRFEDFRGELGLRPSAKHTLDRIDNDGHYSCGHCEECIANGWPANCRWATRTVQNGNTRKAKLLTANGETRPLYEWALLLGLKKQTLWSRLKRGWADERAVNTPVRTY